MQDYGLAVLRVTVAAVFITHGAEKLFGVWGGGLAPTVDFITSVGLRAAYPLAVASAAGELAGGILLFAGAYTVWVTMLLALARAAVLYQFFATGTALVRASRLGRDEFELSVLLVGALITLVLTGPGALSIDARRARSAERAAAGRARLRAGKV